MAENLYLCVKEVFSGYVTYYSLPAPEGCVKDSSCNFLIPPGEEMAISETDSKILITTPLTLARLLVDFKITPKGDSYQVELVHHNLGEGLIMKCDIQTMEMNIGSTATFTATFKKEGAYDFSGVGERKILYTFELKYI